MMLDEDKEAEKQEISRSTRSATSGIRIRKYFPETLYTNPALITDAKGRARIELDMADSITTWRVGTMAQAYLDEQRANARIEVLGN